MIVDNIKNASNYFALSKNFKKALEYILANAENITESIILDDEVKINFASYKTMPQEECPFEAHFKYADVHFILEGGEIIGYAQADSLAVTKEDYDSDYVLLQGSGVNVPLQKGDFMITLPQDAHQPAVFDGKNSHCKKLIAKIKL